MDAINQDVLKQLQEYARRYFAAIVELNTVNGKCNLAPGKYSAKQLIDNSHKSVFGHCFALPEDEVYNENIAVQSGTFRASFPYRRIFAILADWEAMSKAGKLKTVFEIEGAEEKSIKVMTSERTVLGAYKEKKMTLRRIRGNWWGEVKEIRKNKGYSGYYELNGVMFQGGGKTFFGEPEHESTVNFCEKHGDDEMKTAILNYIVQNPRSEFCAYYSEVLSRAGISMDNQEATAIMEASREEKRKRDEEEARELAERKAREEEARRKRQEMETRVKRQMAEKLAKAKEDFVSGNKISEEDFEDIAASIGYEINIRTVGTLRKRVEWIEVDSEGTPTVYGTKRRAGLEGTFEVIREVYTKVKELAATPTETPQISTETAETANVSAEGEKVAERAENKPTAADVVQMVKTELAKNKAMRTTWKLEFPDGTECNASHKCTVAGCDFYEYTETRSGEEVFKDYKATERDITLYICQLLDLDAPQSPETPQAAECTADTPKPRETAGKPQNRGIGSTQQNRRSALGANGYAMLDNASATLTAMYVPRECSTAAMPHGSPPIRGDCKISNSARAKPPNYAKIYQISNYKPP